MMKKLVFSTEELSGYFNGQLLHKGYVETVQDAESMAVHADGLYPQALIEERRPSESEMVQKYRKKIWKSVTQPIYSRVLTELNKIRRSADYTIKYNDAITFPVIPASETLQKYCEESHPVFGSVTNWLFNYILPYYCKDANSVVAVVPYDDAVPTEYLKPFGTVFTSAQVLDFRDNDYCVIRSTDKVIYTDEAGRKTYGNVFYIITTQSIFRYEQTNGTNMYTLKNEYRHLLGYLPAFKVKGLIKKSLDDLFIYKSRLSPMVPRLDEYVREYSDLQAGVVSHLYLERWEITTEDCSECKGEGEISGAYGRTETCPKCHGGGGKTRNPYATMQIKAPMAGEAALPPIPAGFIDKNVEIIKIQDERLDAHEHKALAAINMEYLAQAPLNTSGLKTEVDKDALNNLVHGVAEDLVAIEDNYYRIICDMRYSVVIIDPESRKKMLPYIPVPEKFDLLSSTYMEDQIKKQKENNGSAAIVNAMTKEYVAKKFNSDAKTKNFILAVIKLDPLAGLSDDDKMVRLSNNGITEQTYVISSNIEMFVSRAVEEKGDEFYTISEKEQRIILQGYADELISSRVPKIDPMQQDPNDPANIPPVG